MPAIWWRKVVKRICSIIRSKYKRKWTRRSSSWKRSWKKEGFGVLWQFSVTDKLQEKGVGFSIPMVILEVCNPQEAARVLSKNISAGYFLPCKIVVYKENGITKIGMPKPTMLVGMMDDPELNKLAEDIEQRLISYINQCRWRQNGHWKIAAMNSRAHSSIMERALFSFHHGTPIGPGRLDNVIKPLFAQLAVDDLIELPDFFEGEVVVVKRPRSRKDGGVSGINIKP